jgi:hypothetical protein
LWQGFITISDKNPPTPDGRYIFKIYDAQDSGKVRVKMDTTLSTKFTNTALVICRRGRMTTSLDSLKFGTIKLGEDSTLVFNVKNEGCSEISIANPPLGAGAAFIVDEFPATLKSGEIRAFKVRFLPRERQTYLGRLKIDYSSAGRQDSAIVGLRGAARGFQFAFKLNEIILKPGDTINFGRAKVDSTVFRKIQVSNPKAAEKELSDTLYVTSISATSPDVFQVVSPTPLNFKLAPDSAKDVTISFKPPKGQISAEQNYPGRLDFNRNDQTISSLELIGNGYKNLPPSIPSDSVAITWPTGRTGYTNEGSLTFCLSLANVSAIKEARWKFTQTAGDKPKAPDDTTRYGGRGKLAGQPGKFCFTIPLAAKLGAVTQRWYCYVWLEGTNGASGFLEAFPSEVYYDVTPPAFAALPEVKSPWPGGNPKYTKDDTIRFCWTNAYDLSGIREVRWKFTDTLNAKPKGDNDLGNGGGVIRQGGISCATLLLKGKLPHEGRWYCYLWLVDSLGNSSYANAFRSEFIYDRTPPAKPKPPFERYANGRRISEANWFNRGPLTLMFNLSSGATDAAKVYWKFRSLPKDSLLIKADANNRVSFSIPFGSRVSCGYDSLNFWFADSAGNVNADSFAVVRYRFDICSPVIARTSTREAVANKQKEFIDNLRITDHSFADSNSVAIFYRFGGSRDDGLFLSRGRRKITKFKGTSSETLRVQLNFPAEALTSRGLEYRVAASDSLNSPSLSLWIPVRVRIPTDGEFRTDKDGKAVPFAHGADSSAYRLIAMPFWLDKKKPNEVLGDDLGPYDPTKWRLFDYQGEDKGFVEWTKPNFRLFEPGRAFFLIVRDSNKVIDSGSASTVSTGKDTTLILQEGWNLVGNPFNFPISLDSLEIHNSILRGQIFARERTWDPHIDTFEPWRGYAIKVVQENEGPITLRIPPIAASSHRSKTLARAVEAAGEWTIQITAKAGAELDTINWAGVRKMAAEEYDDFDLVEPPVIGNYVSASFPNMNWSRLAMEYTADFRPLGRDFYEWPLKVATNYASSEVVLQFSGVANLPAGFEAYLVDEAYGVARNLRRNPEYRFVAGANGVEKALKLLAGKPEALQKYSSGIALVPKAFELSQNFPNPFAAKFQQSFTAIRYTLPKSANVTVEVYNMLGQKVRTLVAGQAQAADYYLATWDGRDEAGKEVSSGVYVYRLLAESNGERFTSTKKLLLVK